MKYIILFLLTGLISSLSNNTTNQDFKIIDEQQESLKQRAFIVLKNKCNTCHATKRRVEIFTISNMDSLKIKINNQVFIKRKMPKGKKNQLTTTEEIDLANWIKVLN